LVEGELLILETRTRTSLFAGSEEMFEDHGDLTLEPLVTTDTLDYEQVLYEAIVNEDYHTRVRPTCCFPTYL